jgi:radical SAM superfamily enzyme YgiQ (UPF0313 family)
MNEVAESNDIKERISLAYLAAIAAQSHCQVLEPKIDKQSIDAKVSPISGKKISIDFQLKASSNVDIKDGYAVFNLPKKNYDDLRETVTQTPHYLVLLSLKADVTEWIEVNYDNLLILGTAYWHNLQGLPETTNTTTVTIRIPVTQILNPTTLKGFITNEELRYPIRRG